MPRAEIREGSAVLWTTAPRDGKPEQTTDRRPATSSISLLRL